MTEFPRNPEVEKISNYYMYATVAACLGLGLKQIYDNCDIIKAMVFDVLN